jgi:hypothetical protein
MRSMRDLPDDVTLPAAGAAAPAPKCAACGRALAETRPAGSAAPAFAVCPCGEEAAAATRAAIVRGVSWLFRTVGGTKHSTKR